MVTHSASQKCLQIAFLPSIRSNSSTDVKIYFYLFYIFSHILSSALLHCVYNSQYPKIHRSNMIWRWLFRSWERSGERQELYSMAMWSTGNNEGKNKQTKPTTNQQKNPTTLLNYNFAFLIRLISHLQAGHFICVSIFRLKMEMPHLIINKWRFFFFKSLKTQGVIKFVLHYRETLPWKERVSANLRMRCCLSIQVDTINQAPGKKSLLISMTQGTQPQFFMHMRKGWERTLQSPLHLYNVSDSCSLSYKEGFFSPQQHPLLGDVSQRYLHWKANNPGSPSFHIDSGQAMCWRTQTTHSAPVPRT